MKYRPAYDIRKHPVRHFFDQLWDAKWEIFKLLERVAVISFVTWGGIKYLTKDGKSIKQSLRNKIARVEKSKPVQDFQKNWQLSNKAIKDWRDEYRWQNSPEGKQQAAEARRIRKEREKDMNEMFGKDEWRIKYAKTDEEKKEARQFIDDLMNDRIR